MRELIVLITTVWIIVLALLIAASSVASYLRQLMRRIPPFAAVKLFAVSRESRPSTVAQGGEQKSNRFQADRERVGISLSALHGASMALYAIGLAALFFSRRPEHFWEGVASAAVMILFSIVLFDQLIPFTVLARDEREPEVILGRWVPVLRLSVPLALPLTFPILISSSIRRLLVEPAEKKEEEAKPQEELKELIEAVEQRGVIDRAQGELVQSVVDFGEKIVRDVMTPRPEIAALEINSPLEELRRLIRERRQSRYPVYSGQLDHIEGIVNVRDVMELPPEEQSKLTLRSLVKQVPFVPESKPVRELLKEFQKSTTQLAIVIDEYGSVAGLVTIEDLVEEIVGEIRDEVEPHAKDIVKESPTTYLVAGNTELARLAEEAHVELEGGDGYSTVAGLLLDELGHVPAPGEKVERNGAKFEVLEASARTVLKVRLALPAPSKPAEKPPAPAQHAHDERH